MTDTSTPETTQKPLKAKVVKRRMAKIAEETDAKAAGKKKRKLAAMIVRQIASEQIKSPRAVAKAFVTAETNLTS